MAKYGGIFLDRGYQTIRSLDPIQEFIGPFVVCKRFTLETHSIVMEQCNANVAEGVFGFYPAHPIATELSTMSIDLTKRGATEVGVMRQIKTTWPILVKKYASHLSVIAWQIFGSCKPRGFAMIFCSVFDKQLEMRSEVLAINAPYAEVPDDWDSRMAKKLLSKF